MTKEELIKNGWKETKDHYWEHPVGLKLFYIDQEKMWYVTTLNEMFLGYSHSIKDTFQYAVDRMNTFTSFLKTQLREEDELNE